MGPLPLKSSIVLILMMMFSLNTSFGAKNKNRMLLKKDLYTIIMHSQLLRPAQSELEYHSEKLLVKQLNSKNNWQSLSWLELQKYLKRKANKYSKGRI